ncbi:3' terminal RNA ribose 2'-O-methyltransferase Hen1 [Roseivirga sp. BDSF3-8]|uniref:3' terminal RNA ribose 2'-O-methyltransferase Hen1 n=1 Tax=Roseivirga sp. BDSF3-8 TaxID=3241598 RepID=UPI003531C11D
MLLKITTDRPGARDLSYLLHKHPDRMQSVKLTAGQAHIFYPVADESACSVCLLLDINPIEYIRSQKRENTDFALAQYVNDRPYVASSYMSVAIARAFSTAMNGTCSQRPDLVDEVMPFEVTIAVMPAPKGGEGLIRRLFEPLGYTVSVLRHPLDKEVQEWGESRYYTVALRGRQRLHELLSHLYILIPALDSHKHYWVSEREVEKLLQKGHSWLPDHPEKEQITRRYLKGLGGLTRSAMNRLTEPEEDTPDEYENSLIKEKRERLHDQRLRIALEAIKDSGARTVADLGCGDGKLLRLLIKEKQFTRILGMDVSPRELQKAAERLHMDEMAPRLKERISLIQGALTYRDKRLAGYDAVALIEVIEHMDTDRLPAFERVVFANAKPRTVVLTTPNGDYNEVFEQLSAGELRHSDHRFEWSREEFSIWVDHVCDTYGYQARIMPVGEEAENVGAPSQMAIFNLTEQ